LLEVSAPAKINLFLEILGKRPDGYHEIITFMAALELADTLEFTEDTAGHLTLTCDEPTLPTGSENLVYRAAKLLQRTAGVRRGAQIRLTKRIPVAAGLGGGSSDAAATLVALNELWGLGSGTKELETLAAHLGSDVPFFVSASAAWCTGRGEKVQPEVLKQPLHVVVVCPSQGLRTADVYARAEVPDSPRSPTEMKQALADGSPQHIGAALFNRLEPAAASLSEELRQLAERLEALAPGRHLMSGSGSSCFVLCDVEEQAAKLAHALRAEGRRALATKTRG